MKRIVIVLLLSLVSLPFLLAGEYPEKRTDKDEYYIRGFIPEVGYSFYFPANMEESGYYHGISAGLLLFKSGNDISASFPSFLDMYLKISLSENSRSESSLLYYSLGFDASFEGQIWRSFLIPYYGLDISGLSVDGDASLFCMSPLLGLHIINTRSVSLDLRGNYVYPFTGYDDLAGWSVSLNLSLILWERKSDLYIQELPELE